MVEANRAEIGGDAGFNLPDDLPEPLERLLKYWQSARPDGDGVPSRRQFDPLDLKGMWHGLAVLQFTRQASEDHRIVVRYAGEYLDAMHGQTLAGKRLVDVLDETEAHRSIPSLARVAAEGVPHYRRGVLPHKKHGPIQFERLFVPYLDASNSSIHLVGMWHWPQPEPEGVLRMGGGVHMISSKKVTSPD